jgi:prepilin-type N-terminal cleavage/methylation domain-containing protein
MVEKQISLEIRPNLLRNNNSGFTLMEVMIAIAIFVTFATVFVTGMGYNMMDSGKLKEDILLKDLCENKINDIIINPPELRASLTLTKEIKDIENFENYQTIVEYRKFFVPDMNKIVGKSAGASEQTEENAESSTQEDNQQAQLEQRIFTVFKENVEKMIWQVEVTTKNKTTGEEFKLSTWLFNPNADVKIGAF